MMPYKIAITGRFRTGKDTLANLLTKRLPGPTAHLGFAYALKRELADMVCLYDAPDTNVDDTYAAMQARRDLHGLGWQWLGEYRREVFSLDYWITHPYFQVAYNDACERGHNIIITDMRHHNEAEWCKEHGFYRIRIVGPSRTSGEKESRDPQHSSERHVEELEVELVVPNFGVLAELEQHVDQVVTTWLPKVSDPNA